MKKSTQRCSKNKIINLVNEIKEKSSGKKATAGTSKNEEVVEELICSQEEYPGTHYSVREISLALSVSKTSFRSPYG